MSTTTLKRNEQKSVLEANPPQSHADTETQELIGVATDILEHKKGEEALRQSERQYRLLFEANPQPMWILDSETLRFLAVNDMAVEQYGYSRAEFLSMTIAEIRSTADVPRLVKALDQNSGHTSFGGEWRHTKKNGSLIEVEVLAHNILFEGRECRLVQIKDITIRKQAQAALAYERNLLRTVIDTIPHNIYVRDTNGRYVLNNQLHLHSLGASSPEEVLGKTPFDFFPPDIAEQYLDNDRTVLESQIPKIMREEVTRDRQGNVLWHSVTKAPLFDLSNNAEGIVCLTEDITERKLAEEALAKEALKLEQNNRELQEFSSVASHDLQEPLRKIQAFGDRLQAKYGAVLNEEGRDYLSRMQSAAGRMQTLITNLLDLSRVTSRGQPFIPVDLNTVIREVVSDLEIQIQRTGGRVEVGEMPTMDGDPLQIRQLLQNLISNALKFHRAEEAPRVKIQGCLTEIQAEGCSETSPSGERCTIIVSDNGIGFDEKYLDRIFTPFQRLHTRGEYEGTGIGLTICRKIVERHSGSITAKSVPDQGTVFIITFPLRQQKGYVTL